MDSLTQSGSVSGSADMAGAPQAAPKVLFLVNAPGPNTSEIYDALTRSGRLDVEVAYLVRHNEKWRHGAYRIAHRTVPVRSWSLFRRGSNTAFSPGVLKHVLTGGHDVIVIQAYSNPTNLLAIVLLALLKRRTWVFWGERIKTPPGEIWPKRALKRLVAASVGAADRVYAVGRKGVEAYVALGVDPSKTASLTYAKDLSEYRACNSDARRDGTGRRVVCTARLVRSKRLDLLLDAFAELAGRFPDWQLVLIGDGPCRERLQRRVPDALRDRVVWHGYGGKADQCRIYATSDVFVLPSDADGWGMVVLEAMAAGLPVIATEGVVAAWDLIEDGVTGYRIPVGDHATLKARLGDLMSDISLRTRMSGAAAERTREWDLDAVVQRFERDLLHLTFKAPNS